MRKQTKIVAVASAAALLAIGASMTAFAAQGWVEEDGTWYYYDRDGSRVEDQWKRSGDNWYWLSSEENGAMAVDTLVEDDNDIYYVDTNGVMVRNTWVRVVNEDQDDDDDPAEYNYYYMQSNGKAYRDTNDGGISKKTIDGKIYTFDEDGKMLYGWVTEDGELANGEDEWADEDTVYYFGNWDDGAMKTGWQKIYVHDSEPNKDDDYYYWFNFKPNGKKRTHSKDNQTWKYNNGRYHFDSRGVMVYQWFETNGAASGSTPASTANWSYFRSPEEGARVTKGFFKVVAPTEDNMFTEDDNRTFATTDSDDEGEQWYYADGDGQVVSGEIMKDKGKYYGFWPEYVESDGTNKSGRMLTGLCLLETDGSKIIRVLADNMDSDKLDDFMNSEGDFALTGKFGAEYGLIANKTQDISSESGIYLYYFGKDEDADVDGAMKTGNVSINLDGETYQFMFKKSGGVESRGRGVNGYDDEKYVYHYGLKVKADSDDKYALVHATGDINDPKATVEVYTLEDIRDNDVIIKDDKLGVLVEDDYTSDDGTVRVISNFGTRNKTTFYVYKDGKKTDEIDKTCDGGWYLVNSSGRIQDGTKTGVRDGNDWYWYIDGDDNIIMYTDSKDLDPHKNPDTKKVDVWDLKSNWKTTPSYLIGDKVY